MPERDGEGRNPCSNVTGGSWETKITSFLPNQSGRCTNSLTGVDVVGAAKTGSGKTLAFLIPLLECLWRQRWSRMVDGLGALIISPTRELAFQTFQVLNKIGAHHQFSVAVLNFRIVRHSFAEPVFYLDNTTFVKPEWKMY